MQLQEDNRSLKHVIYSENKVPFLLFPIDFLSTKNKLGGSNKLLGGDTMSIKLCIYITKYTLLKIVKAKMQAISSDTHQLQLFKLHHFKLEIFKSI